MTMMINITHGCRYEKNKLKKTSHIKEKIVTPYNYDKSDNDDESA